MTNSKRYFVDCIDVFDTPLPSATSSTAPGTGYAYHTQDLLCTLFLFNDCFIIAKRKIIDQTGRELVGLDNINKLTADMLRMQQASNGTRSPFKGKTRSMEFCGKFDLGDLVAKDLGSHGEGIITCRVTYSRS